MEEPCDRLGELFVGCRHERRAGDDQNVPAGLERGRQSPECLAEAAAKPIADDRSADLSTGRQSEPGISKVRPQDSYDEEGVGPNRPGFLERREVPWTGEHHETRRVSASLDQAVSRFRPRARRAARIRRPPVDLIRARKPCSLARWRFFGW